MAEVSIQEAAQRLGISVVAVRKRAQRGSLKAIKRDGAWLVEMEGEQPMSSPDSPPTPQRDGGAPVGIAQIEANNLLLQQMLLEQIAVKDRQIEQKDRQLEQAEVERAELRRLLGNSQRQLGAAQEQVTLLITANTPDPTVVPDAPAPPGRAADDSSAPSPNGPQSAPERAHIPSPSGWRQRLVRAILGLAPR